MEIDAAMIPVAVSAGPTVPIRRLADSQQSHGRTPIAPAWSGVLAQSIQQSRRHE